MEDCVGGRLGWVDKLLLLYLVLVTLALEYLKCLFIFLLLDSLPNQRNVLAVADSLVMLQKPTLFEAVE